MNDIKGNTNRSIQILSLITLQGNRGSTIEFLVQESGVDRWTVGDICKKLESSRKIKNKRKGRVNIYYPNQTAYDYSSYIESLLFKKKIISNYLSDNISFDTSDILSKSRRKFNKKDLSKMNWYLSRKQKESILKIIDDDKDVDIKENGSISLNILQQKLQSFVLNVGVFVTFVFLISSSLKLKKAISKYLESDSEELINLEILNWLSRIISPKDLYNDFRQMFSRCGIRDFEYKNFSDNNKKTTTFDLTESLFIEVSNFLEQSYPKQYSKLNEIYQKLKDDYDKEKKFVSQKNCNHKYKVTDESIDWIIFTCEKCERVIPCQKSNIWNSHQITEKLRVGIYQTNNKVELRQTNSEISDINTNCNFFSGNHQIFLRIGQNEDILNGESIVETFECILCRRNWHFIISRDTMEKISIDIESYVGSDIYSKILSSALFKFILHDKKLSVDSDEITLKKLELFGLYPKYLKHIKEFEKDKKTMLKIFQKYNFIT